MLLAPIVLVMQAAAPAAPSAPPAAAPPAVQWSKAEAPVLAGHRQLTFPDRFVKAGESYFSPDDRRIVFQAIERPADGSPPPDFYAMFVADLERDTSGVIVLARDAATHRALSMQFERRETAKRYAALVAGHPPRDAGEIDLPIRKDLVNTPLQVVDFVRGRPSVTRWRVAGRVDAPPRARLELEPVTGRSHQLRVHLLAIGHPILGDDLYAPPPVRAMAERLCLHAERLSFVHPASGERVEFAAPVPF